MVDPAILSVVRGYLGDLSRRGLPVRFAVIFGSRAAGRATERSDIDLLVVSPEFDRDFARSLVDLLWRVAARVDSRIEPLPCGETQWLEDDSTPIIEAARREGIKVDAPSAV